MIIMMTFFFTMPISRMIPIAETREIAVVNHQPSRAPRPAEGIVERMVNR